MTDEYKKRLREAYLRRENRAAEAKKKLTQRYFDTKVRDDILSRTNAWISNTGELIDGHNERYEGGSSIYRNDAEDYFSSVSGKKNEFDAEADSILALLDKYKGYYDEEWGKKIRGYLSADAADAEDPEKGNNRTSYNSVYDRAQYDRDFFASFESEDAYNKWLKESEAEEKKREGYAKYDSAAGEAEIERIREFAERMRAIDEEGQKIKNEAGAGSYAYKAWERTAAQQRYALSQEYLGKDPAAPNSGSSVLSDKANVSKNNLAIDSSMGHIDDIIDFDALLTEKEQYHNLATEYQELQNMSSVGKLGSSFYDPEFESYVAYDDSKRDSIEYADVNEYYSEMALIYHYINSDEAGKKEIENNISAYNGGATYQSAELIKLLEFADRMEPEEKKLFNYYYNSPTPRSWYFNKDNRDKTRSEKYFEALKETLDKREAKYNYDYGKDHPVLGSIYSISEKIYGGFETVDNVIDHLVTGEKLDNSSGAAASSSLRAGVSSDMSSVGKFFYNTAMSGVDSLVNNIAFGKAGSVMLALSAGADAINDGLDRGMSDDKAIANGVAAGLFEGIFESLSLGQFDALKEVSPKTWKDIGLNIAKSMGVNASEEMATEIANITYDIIANGELSNYQKMINDGMTSLEALGQFGLQVLESGASGALMGFGFGGIGSAHGAISNAYNTAQAGKGYASKHGSAGVNELISKGLSMNESTAAYKQASKLQNKAKTSNYAIGKLLGSMSESQMSTALQARLGENSSTVANTIVKLIGGQEVSNKALNSVMQRDNAIDVLNETFGVSLTKDSTASDVRKAISRATESNSKQKGTAAKFEAVRTETMKELGVNMDGLSAENYADTIASIVTGADVSNTDVKAVLDNKFARNALNKQLGVSSSAKLTASSTVSDVRSAVSAQISKSDNVSPARFSMEKVGDAYAVVAEAEGERGVISLYKSQKQAQAAVYAMTLGMGSEGSRGFIRISEDLSRGASLGDAAQAFNAIYRQGKQGKALSAVQFGDALTAEQRQYAYQAGIVDGMLDSARAKNAAAEISKENDGKVLQKDGVGDTIEESDGAIWRYKSSESYKINEAIRSGRELSEEESAFIEELDNELDKVPKYNGVVYRNMTFDFQGQEELDNFVAGHSAGSIVTYPAYTSTSKSKEGYIVEGELLVHLEIYGENGHDVSKGYGIEEEQEVLFDRNTDFYVSSVSYDGKTANIVLEEVVYGEKEVSGIDKGNNSAQQGYGSQSGASEVQRMQTSEQMDVQKVSGRNSKGNSSQRGNLQGVREEVISDPDVQQAKENAIEPERMVYSSEKAMAYDAVVEDRLSADQKKAVDVGKDIGRKVVICDTRTADGVPVDGFLGNDGVIYISKNNKSPVAFIFKHELAHFCERAGQKYQDFIDSVRKSAAFKNWLKQKGMNSELEYNRQIRQERATIGQDPGERGATMEIMANFVGDIMFGDDTTLADSLIGELKPKQKRSVREFLRDFFEWIKGRFTGKGNTARTEIHRLEKMFGEAFRTAVKVEQGSGEQFAFNDSLGQQLKDWIKGGGKKYGSYNGEYFELGTTPDILVKHGAKKVPVIMSDDCVAKVTGMKNDSGHNISLDEIAKLPSQLNDPILLFKGSYPNSFVALTEIVDKQGHEVVVAIHINKFEKRTKITKIASLYSKTDDYGNNKIVRYVQNQINQGNLVDASTKKAPNWFTIRGLQLPKMVQTILDANNSISQKSEKSTQNSKNFSGEGGESFSYNSQNDKVDDVVGRYENGEITIDELKRLLKKPEKDNPVKIANAKKEDMGSTPKINKKTSGSAGDGSSKFAESLQKSKIFDENFKAEVKDDNFVKHYAAITNKETLAEAAARLNEGGEAYVREWLSKKVEHMDTVDTMVGFILLKRFQDVGDYTSAAAVAQKVREVGTLSGQRVQAFSIIGRFDADMMQTYAQKELEKAWELAIKGRSQKWIDKHAEQFKLTDEEITFIRDHILYAAQLPENSRARAIALAQITTLLQNKLPPANFGQSYKAWQRISMLLNPKTQIRNVAGNLLSAPVFVASDWFSTPVDFIVSKFTGVRTTGLTGLRGSKTALKAFGKGAFESFDDWRRHINTKNVTGNRFEIGQGKSFDETRWGRIAKIMNSFDEFTSFLLDAGDRPFYEMWFTNSLNEQMRLNKVSEPTEEMVQIAVDEALSRTWQDENLMTKMVSGIKRSMNHIQIGGYGVGDIIIKFTKTPANLTKAIYDFSPAAIATLTPQAIRLTKAIKNGTVTPSMQKKFVSNFGKMAAGTMLYVAFAALYAAGRITGSSDEDKDVAAFEKYIQGIPAYSIKFGDKWFSYDWAQPIGAVPAIIADYMESRKDGSDATRSIYEAFKAGGSVLYNQSFMSSIQTLFAADDPLSGVLDLVSGEVTVPIPTIFSQLANVLDDKRRVTYDSTSEFKSALNRAMFKIPGLRNTLEAEVDVLGREVENSSGNKLKDFANAFVNPANTYTDTSTDMTDHAYEIYQSTGDVGAIPPKAPYSVGLQGKTVKLSDTERVLYQKAMGEVSADLIELLLENDVYNAMSDEEKLAVLKQIYSYSGAVAKSQLDWTGDYEVINGIAPYITQEAFNTMSYEERYKIVDDYIFSDYEGMQKIESDKGQANFLINKKTGSMVLEATRSGDIDGAVKLIQGIEDRVTSFGWDKEDTAAEIKERKASVKTVLTHYWKAAYRYAYYNGDKEEQERIFDILVDVGLYGDKYEVKKQLRKWIEDSEE